MALSSDMFPDSFLDYVFDHVESGVPWRHDEIFQEPWDRLEEKEDDDR